MTAQPLQRLGSLHAQAAALAAAGWQPIPRSGKWIAGSLDSADGLDLATGRQRSGYTLVRLDLDSHHEWQDAPAELARLEAELGPLGRRLAVQRSLGGSGRDVLFLTSAEVASGNLYRNGKQIGECMAAGGAGRAHADAPFLRGSLDTLPVLSPAEAEQVLRAAGHQPHKTDRGQMRRLGESLTAGFERYARPDVLRGHLVDLDGVPTPRMFDGPGAGQRIGRQLWRWLILGERNVDRSAVYGNLVQSLAYHADKSGVAADRRWQLVRALAEHTGAGGKVRDKDYRIGKDTAAIIGKIATGAPRDGGGAWKTPRWALGGRAAVVVVEAIEEAREAGPGRPSTLTPDELLRWYGEEAGKRELVGSRRRDAEALGISVPTLDRLDRALRERGDITIETLPGRSGRRITLTPSSAIKNIVADYPAEVLSAVETLEPAERITTPNTAPEPAQCNKEERSPEPSTPPPAEPPAAGDAPALLLDAPAAPAQVEAAAPRRPQGAPASGDPCPAPAEAAPRQPRPFDPAEWARRFRGPQEVKRYARLQAIAPEPRPEPPAAPRPAQVVLPLGPADPLLAELAAVLELRAEDEPGQVQLPALPEPPAPSTRPAPRRSSAQICRYAPLPPRPPVGAA